MTPLKRSAHCFLICQRIINLYTPQPLRLSPSCVSACNSIVRSFHERKQEFGFPQKGNPKRSKFKSNLKQHSGKNDFEFSQKGNSKQSGFQSNLKQQFGWIKKMHESLLSDVSLPLPSQAIALFDPDHLKTRTLEDLLSLVWDVAQIDREATNLLIELWRRMDSMSPEQMISVADVFFVNNVHSSWYLGAMAVYTLEVIDTLELTASQLTRLTFHVLDRNRSTPPGFCLTLENAILRHFDSLSLNQLAVICTAFFTSQTRIRSMDLLDNISAKLIRDFDSLDNWYLPIFMKTMRFSNFIKISFYRELGDIIVKKNYLAKFRSLSQIMHIAHAFASVRISHPELFSYILNTCCHAGYKFRLKDLSKLIWSCGTLVTDSPEDIATIRKILIFLEHNLPLDEVLGYPDNLVDLVNGLCFLNIFSDSLLNKLFHPENVAAVLGLRQNREKIPQLSVIDHSLRIEYPSYSGHQLNEESRNIVNKRLGSFPIEKEISIKKGLKEAVDALIQILGEDRVFVTKLLPHFQLDILLTWDTEESTFVKCGKADLATSLDGGRYQRLALLVLSNMQTSYDGKPLGMLHIKLRQLQILGYKTIVIDAEDARQFVYNDTLSTQDFLLKALAHALDV